MGNEGNGLKKEKRERAKDRETRTKDSTTKNRSLAFSPILLSCMTVTLISLVTCLPSRFYDWTHDDIFAVVINPLVQGGVELGKIMELDFWGYQLDGGDGWSHKSWRPITTVTWRFLNEISSGRCTPQYTMHTFNVLAYAASSGAATHVLWTLLELVDPEGGKGVRWVTATFCGSLFALHPVHSEVVGNITHGAEIFSSLFVFAAISSWGGRDRVRVGWKDATLIGILGFGATLCKETGLMVVPFVGLSEAIVTRRRGWVEFCGVLVVLCAVMAGGRGYLTFESEFTMNAEFNPLVGKVRGSKEWLWGIADVHLDVLGLMLVPWFKSFCFDRVFEGSGTASGMEIWVLAMYGSFFVLLGAGFRWREAGAGKVILLSLLLFGAFFLPASQVPFSVGFYVAERTLYIPILGVILLGGWLWERGASRYGGSKMGGIIFIGGAVFVAASTGAIFGDVLRLWVNKRTLYEGALVVNEKSFNAMRGLGEYWYSTGNDFEKSISFYSMAITSKNPEDEKVLPDWFMSGKVGLAWLSEGGEEKNITLKDEVREWLRISCTEGWHYLQARAAHDYGYFLWWYDGREEVKMEARGWMRGAAEAMGHFPAITDRERLMIMNNAGCGEWLTGHKEIGLEWFRKAEEWGRLKVWGKENQWGYEGYAITMNNLAIALRGTGDGDQADEVVDKVNKLAGGEVKIDGDVCGSARVFFDFVK